MYAILAAAGCITFKLGWTSYNMLLINRQGCDQHLTKKIVHLAWIVKETTTTTLPLRGSLAFILYIRHLRLMLYT